MDVCHKHFCTCIPTSRVTFPCVLITFHYVLPYNATQKTTITFAYVSSCTPAILRPLFKDLSSDQYWERTPIPKVEPRSWVATPPPCGPLGFAEWFSYVSLRLGSRLVMFGNGSWVSDSWAQRHQYKPSQHPSLTWTSIHICVQFPKQTSGNKGSSSNLVFHAGPWLHGPHGYAYCVSPCGSLCTTNVTFCYVAKVMFFMFRMVPPPYVGTCLLGVGLG